MPIESKMPRATTCRVSLFWRAAYTYTFLGQQECRADVTLMLPDYYCGIVPISVTIRH